MMMSYRALSIGAALICLLSSAPVSARHTATLGPVSLIAKDVDEGRMTLSARPVRIKIP
jgi:hypothetical protein